MVPIRKHAERALVAAAALGRFPTAVDDVMAAARVVVSDEDALDADFLTKLRKRAGSALMRALSKVLGVLDAAAKIVYIDRSIHVVKRTFLKLHETAHAVLPWQRDIFVVAEDCEQTLAPEIAESFEREANAFACEVLFQLDAFQNEAEQEKISILPLNYSRAPVFSAT
jgi:Zn-dependent peptidase ImmA (M78 family)